MFKELCHKFKNVSNEFLKTVIEDLAIPIKNFIKNQVFYYEVNENGTAPMRQVFKVKKQWLNDVYELW